MARLFFALQPKPAQRVAIAAAMRPMMQALGAKPVTDANLHLTLAFLGDVPAEAIPGLQRAVAGTPARLMQLALSRIDCWKRSGVLCLVPEETAAVQALHGLAKTLSGVARSAGITLDDKPFCAHVTVARKVPPSTSRARSWPQPLPAPLPFTASGFVLMESTRGPEGQRYDVIGTWPAPPGDM